MADNRHRQRMIALCASWPPAARRRVAVCVLLAAVGAAPFLAQAQLFQDNPLQRTARDPILARSSPIEGLLKRAEEAISRQDWKLAIDSAQRVLDGEQDALVAIDEPAAIANGIVRYESARTRAMRMLASMPADGIKAYRLLHDGRAGVLLQTGRDRVDGGALREIVDRYMVSSFGDDAAALLAGWRIDQGRPVEALDLLDRAERYCPDADVSPWRMQMLRAAAWALFGDKARADGALDAATAQANTPEQHSAVEELAKALPALASRWAAGEPAQDETWAVTAGGPLRQNVMADVSPELRDRPPWRFELPAEDPDWWRTHYLEDRPAGTGLPVATPVVAGGRIFIKNLRHIVALDLDSFAYRWITEPPVETVTAIPRRYGWNRFIPVAARDQFSDRERLLEDFLGASVSVAFGKVYSIDRQGIGEPEGGVARRTIEWRRSTASSGSRLAAFDAETGKLVWARGRSGDPNDELGDVHFLSIPLAVGDELWVVFAKSSDLSLAALDPASGRVLRKLPLCSSDESSVERLEKEAIQPAFDGYLVYVPTGLGVVCAVKPDDFSLVWATQYPRDVLGPWGWRCRPPVVSDRAVVVTTSDSPDIMAIDRLSGELLWSRRRPQDVRYLLGADMEHVWLAGSGLWCLSAADGSTVWQTDARQGLDATGRGALCRSKIFMPTSRGLAIFDAATGMQLAMRELPAGEEALGNLLCIGGAMVSVDTNELRKFPDLGVAYPKLLANHEQNPTDADLAVRLAWSELLRGDPERAYHALEPLKAVAQDRREDVAHLRVMSLLAMARAADGRGESALADLEEARTLARAPRDQLRASVAYAVEVYEAGRREDAYLLLWHEGMKPAADGYVSISPNHRMKATLYVGEVLSRFSRDLTAVQLRAIADETLAAADAAGRALDTPTPGEAGQRLLRLAELNDVGGGGQAALIRLGRWERAKGELERSEQRFREAIRLGRIARLTATAMRDLAEQYLDDRQHYPLEAGELLDSLVEYSHVDLAAAGDGSLSGSVPARAEVDRLRRRLQSIGAPATSGQKPARFALAESPVLPGGSGDEKAPRVFSFAPTRPEAANSLVLMAATPGKVFARDVRYVNRDAVAWSADLELLGSHEAILDDSETLEPDESLDAIYPRAFCDGQIAVVNGADGLFGIGLRTGRRLWGIPYEEASTASRYPLRNRLVAVGDGYVVCAPRRGVLSAARLADASDVLWERILGTKVDTVFVKDGYCITLDAGWQLAKTYDLANGSLLSSVTFNQPDPVDAPIPLQYMDGLFVGPDGSGAVACHSVVTGQQLWRLETPAPVQRLFAAADGEIGVWMAKGSVLLVDALQGDVKLEATVPQVEDCMAEGVIHDDTLVLLCVKETARGADPTLVGLDCATGQVQWTRGPLGPTVRDESALWPLLHVAQDVVPMFYRYEPEDADVLRRMFGVVGVRVIDKATGADYGPVVQTNQQVADKGHLTGDFGVWPGAMIVGAENAILALPIDEKAPQAETKRR